MNALRKFLNQFFRRPRKQPDREMIMFSESL